MSQRTKRELAEQSIELNIEANDNYSINRSSIQTKEVAQRMFAEEEEVRRDVTPKVSKIKKKFNRFHLPLTTEHSGFVSG